MEEPPAFRTGPSAPRGLRVEIQHPTLEFATGRVEHMLAHVLREEGVSAGEITVVLSDHETVHDLNRRFLNHDYLTDVLAFDYAENPDVVEGEIYVDTDTAAERCNEFGASFDEEVLRYVVHGLLHLIGYSDRDPDGRQEMRRRENRYLASLRD